MDHHVSVHSVDAQPYAAMLRDRVRLARYRAAIDAVVRPGSVVADVGAGIGVLSLFAARAGARKVYAVERAPGIADLARRIIAANGLEAVIEVIVGDARTITLPRPADIVVAELMGNAGVDEQIQSILGRFCADNLAPEGRVVPERVRCLVAASDHTPLSAGLASPVLADFDLSPAEAQHGGLFFHHHPISDARLSPTAILDEVGFPGASPTPIDPVSTTLTIERAGELRSLLIWFEADLAPGLTLTNPPEEMRENWLVGRWEFPRPIPVEPGRRVHVTAETHGRHNLVGWTIDAWIE
jgi:precorrin-6B methylase 2